MKSLNLLYSRHNVDRPCGELKLTRIPYCDLTVVFKGALEYTVDGKSVTVNGGDMIFMPEGTSRERKQSAGNVDYISFNFVSESKIELPVFVGGAVHSEIILVVGAYDKINKATFLNNKEKNEHLLLFILSVLEDRAKRRSLNPLTLKVMEYIHNNLTSRITLDDIGRYTYFSPIYCDTLFKKETGHSIIDYLLDKRIDEAKKLLFEGNLSLQSVSEAVGFNDYNYFSRVFKARSGYSPSAYRKYVLTDLVKKT